MLAWNRKLACFAAVFLCLNVARSRGQEAQKLISPAPTGYSYFGTSVSVRGDTAVVGIPAEDGGRGAAIVFVRSAEVWSEQLELTAPGAAIGDAFGSSVAIQGDWIAVGAPEKGTGLNSTGAVYLFRRTGGVWSFHTELLGALSSDRLGASVALDGELLAAGAPGTDNAGPGAVEAFRFDGASWGSEARLTATGGALRDQLGASVAVSGDTLLAGAPSQVSAGYAVPFERSSGAWVEQPRLQGSAGGYQDEFGGSVGLWGDALAVGAPRSDPGLLDQGAAYVFRRSGPGWSEEALLLSSAPGQNRNFGSSVALFGDLLLVGEPGGLSAGTAHLYLPAGGGWSEVVQLQGSDVSIADGFAQSLATDGRRALVGAPRQTAGVAGNAVRGEAYDPATDTLYGTLADFGDLIIVKDAFQGSLVGAMGFDNVQCLAFDSASSTLYGVDVATDQLITLDTATGAGTAVGPVGFANVRALACDPVLGVLYGVDAMTKQLLAIDPASGAGTAIGPTGFVGLQGLGFDAAAGTLFGLDQATSNLLIMDTQTGLGTPVGMTTISAGWCLTFDSGLGLLQSVGPFGPPPMITIEPLTAVSVSLGPLSAPDAGAVYDFELDLVATYCTAGTSAAGCSASLSAVGLASSTLASGFVLTAAGVEGTRPGIFFFGSSGRQASPWSGASFQCVAPPLVRTGVLPGSGTPGACDGVLSQDLNALWCATCPKPAKNPGPGALLQGQLWYRDPLSSGSLTVKFSNAIEFLVGL